MCCLSVHTVPGFTRNPTLPTSYREHGPVASDTIFLQPAWSDGAGGAPHHGGGAHGSGLDGLGSHPGIHTCCAASGKLPALSGHQYLPYYVVVH